MTLFLILRRLELSVHQRVPVLALFVFFEAHRAQARFRLLLHLIVLLSVMIILKRLDVMLSLPLTVVPRLGVIPVNAPFVELTVRRPVSFPFASLKSLDEVIIGARLFLVWRHCVVFVPELVLLVFLNKPPVVLFSLMMAFIILRVCRKLVRVFQV